MGSLVSMLQPSKTDVYSTPRWLFDSLAREFSFTLDPCATADNAKCDRYFTAEDDGLQQDWGSEVVFMNPPYSRVAKWMEKAHGASLRGATVVCLVPSRTDAHWWHRFALKGEIRFIRGRLRFGDEVKRLGGSGGAPFPSVIIVFRPQGFSVSSATL